MLKIKHVPEQLIDVTLTPVLFTLMFTYMFGGAIAGSTGEYLQYILPGILVMSVLFTTVYSGVTLNTDVTKGVVDRFRSLPIWRPAPLVGAVIGDSVRYLVAATVVVLVGVILGFDPEAGFDGVIAAMLLVIVFSFGLAWVFTTVGLLMRSPSAVMNTGFMALFPLTFLSNMFVEPKTLPKRARGVRQRQPDLGAGDRLARAHARRRRRRRHRDRARHRRGPDADLRPAHRAPLPQGLADATGACAPPRPVRSRAVYRGFEKEQDCEAGDRDRASREGERRAGGPLPRRGAGVLAQPRPGPRG